MSRGQVIKRQGSQGCPAHRSDAGEIASAVLATALESSEASDDGPPQADSTVTHVVHIVPPPPGGVAARLRRLRGLSDPIPADGPMPTQRSSSSRLVERPPSPADANDVADATKHLDRHDALLTVDDVCARYGGCDPRTARAIMWQAGAFRAAGKVWIHHGKLVAFETASANRGAASATQAGPVLAPRKRRSEKPGTEGVEVGSDDWWREG